MGKPRVRANRFSEVTGPGEPAWGIDTPEGRADSNHHQALEGWSRQEADHRLSISECVSRTS